MINSRKAIWADNLRCAHMLKLPQAALVFSCVCMCIALAAEIYMVHGYSHNHLSLSLEHFSASYQKKKKSLLYYNGAGKLLCKFHAS